MPYPVARLKKSYGLSAGKYYSSGTFHGAWDIPCPTYTKIRAAMGGYVIGFNRGVPVNRTGGSGAPSNWVLIYTPPFPGFPKGVTSYYQHLAGVGKKVKTGAWINGGENFAESDNTGNSSGPHLHWHVMKGKQARYAGYSNHSLMVYPPSAASKAWDKHATIKRNLNRNPIKPGERSAAVVKVKKAMGLKSRSKKYGLAMKRKVKKIQKRSGLPKTGVIDNATWKAIR